MSTRNSARLPLPVRLLTRYVALMMAFALGFILAFVTKLQPHLVAISFGLVMVGAIYCVLLAIAFWLIQRRATRKPTLLK